MSSAFSFDVELNTVDTTAFSSQVWKVGDSQLELFDTHCQRLYVDVSDVTVKAKGQKVLSLFSGTGGLDIGLEGAGFETIGCVEVDPDCRRTLGFNRPEWRLLDGDNLTCPGDIRFLRGEDVLEQLQLEKGELDLMAGGPPCQSFSNLGLKRGSEDPKNGDLSLHYLRLCEEVLPKAILFENVEGILHQKHDQFRSRLLGTLEQLGYNLQTAVVTASDYGDPQNRRRFILIGHRSSQKPSLPAPMYFATQAEHRKLLSEHPYLDLPFKKHRTVLDAFEELAKWRLDRPDNLSMGVSEVVRKRMELVGPGQNFKVVPDDLLPDCWKSGKHQGADTFGRLRYDRPSVTIRTSAYNPAKGRYIHPALNRGLSTLEMAVLQSFPESWQFRCQSRPTLVGIGKMIGNAVPIRLAEALGLALWKVLSAGNGENLG